MIIPMAPIVFVYFSENPCTIMAVYVIPLASSVTALFSRYFFNPIESGDFWSVYAKPFWLSS